MKITIAHTNNDAQSTLCITIPRKYDVVAELLRDYCASKTGKQVGLGNCDVFELILIKSNGKEIGPKEKIRNCLSDGDVVHIQERQYMSVPEIRNAATESKENDAVHKSIKISIGQAKQLTKKAEDFIMTQATTWRGIDFWAVAVCDGHGGQRAAASARDRLLPSFLQALERICPPHAHGPHSNEILLGRYAAKALVEAFQTVDAAVSASSDAGSTATLSLILPGSIAALSVGLDLNDSDDEADNTINSTFSEATTNMPYEERKALGNECCLVLTANVGDSLAYIDEALALELHTFVHKASPCLASHDHRLDRNTSEQQRCRDAGGRVSRDDTDLLSKTNQSDRQKRPLRLWPGGLMMSRVLGDRDAKQALSIPQVRCAIVARGAARLIIASDGLWDEMNAKQAFKLVAPIVAAPDKAAQVLATEAKKRGSRRNDTDDVAVIVVDMLLTCGHGSPILRLWDVDPENSSGLAGPELDSALAATRRSKVAEAALDLLPAAQTTWCGLAAEPARFYEPRRVLGSGGFGRVIECTERLGGRRVAIKIMTKVALRRKHHQHRARVERDALLALKDSPLTVNLLCAWHDEAAVYLVLPLASRGDLSSALKKQGNSGLGIVVTAFYGAQLICALDFAHSRGVMHRRVEPSNLLLDSEAQLKLCDLGLARPISERCTTQCGTPEYWSPEIVKNIPYGTATDLWSAAVTVYELLAGFSPFGNDAAEQEDNIKTKKQQKNKEMPETIQEAILNRPLRFSSNFNDDSRHLLEHWLERNASVRLGVASDGVSAESRAIQAHVFWRAAMSTSSLNSVELWWQALGQRQIQPPRECIELVRPDTSNDKVELAKMAAEARKFLSPDPPRDEAQSCPMTTSHRADHTNLSPRKASGLVFPDTGVQQRRSHDPFDGFEYDTPGGADALTDPLPSRPLHTSNQFIQECNMALITDAVLDSAVIALHALGRGYLVRRALAIQTNAAATLRTFFIHCLRLAALSRRLIALPRLRRAAVVAAKSAKRRVIKEWFRFAARIACLEAARKQQRLPHPKPKKNDESNNGESILTSGVDQTSTTRRKKKTESKLNKNDESKNTASKKKTNKSRNFVPVNKVGEEATGTVNLNETQQSSRGRGRKYRPAKTNDKRRPDPENTPENKTYPPRQDKVSLQSEQPDKSDEITSVARGRSQGRGRGRGRGRFYFGRGRGGRRGRSSSGGSRVVPPAASVPSDTATSG